MSTFFTEIKDKYANLLDWCAKTMFQSSLLRTRFLKNNTNLVFWDTTQISILCQQSVLPIHYISVNMALKDFYSYHLGCEYVIMWELQCLFMIYVTSLRLYTLFDESVRRKNFIYKLTCKVFNVMSPMNSTLHLKAITVKVEYCNLISAYVWSMFSSFIKIL